MLNSSTVHTNISEILEIWDLLDAAYLSALRSNDVQASSDILAFYPPIPLPLPISPTERNSHQIMEDILEYHFRPQRCAPPPPDERPPESECEYQKEMPPACINCIPGLLVCKIHQKLCKEPCWISCEHCERLLCFDHTGCFCQSWS